MSKDKRAAKGTDKTQPCPCGGMRYATCCEPYHLGTLPVTAEQLMRSRYSAFVLGQWEYIHHSWHSSTKPSLASLQQDVVGKWLGLEVRNHQPDGDRATVEFVARHKADGRAQRLHEISRFVREQGQWYYVDGSFPDEHQ